MGNSDDFVLVVGIAERDKGKKDREKLLYTSGDLTGRFPDLSVFEKREIEHGFGTF